MKNINHNKTKNPNYIDGRTLNKYYCKCGNNISYNNWKYGTKKCLYCAHKGRYNPSFRHGETLKKHYCIDCNKKISYNNFMQGKKRCRSCSRKGKFSHFYGHAPYHGKGNYYKDIWFRSSWEVAYAKYLDKNRIKWLYEPKTFDLGTTTYTPDFYLPETNTYVEIKGYWRDKSKKKFNLFEKLYVDIKIQILDKLKLQSLRILK